MCDSIELPKSPFQDNNENTEFYSPPTPPESINHQNLQISLTDPHLDPELQSKDQIIAYLSIKYQEEQNRHLQEVTQLKTQLAHQEKIALDNKLAHDRMRIACRKWKDKHDSKAQLLDEKEVLILKKDVRISELEIKLKRENGDSSEKVNIKKAMAITKVWVLTSTSSLC